MDYQTITLKEFRVIGITVRTTNEKNKAQKDIPVLWNNFYMDRVMYKIPHKESQEIVSLYIDYEKDVDKPYSVVLGYRVSSIEDVPKGMTAKTVPASKYAVFHVKGDILAQEIRKAWEQIWRLDLDRAYTGDFEVYMVENTHEADIFVAINS